MLFGKHINRYYIKYAYLLLVGIAALILVDYLQLIIPELYRNVINGLNQGYVTLDDGTTAAFDMDYLLDEVCLPMIGIIVGIVTGRFLWRVCFNGSGNKVAADLRYRMFDHCKDLSQQYYQKNKVGNLMSLFTNDLETIRDCYSNGILMTCDAAFLGILSFIKMLRMNYLMALLCMIPIALLFGVGLTLMQYMEKKWDERQEAFSKLSDFSQESFSGIAVIKAFVKEGKELMAFRKLNKENENANVEYTRLSTLLTIFVTLLVESVICVILGYGSFLVYKGTFNAGQLVEFMGYFNSIVWPVMAVAELINMHSQGTASLKRISELLDAEIDVKDREDATDIDNVRGDIEFRDLTFRYPDGEYDVLKNASFKINAGESVGVIGRTGAGKTTLADLILRIYNVPDGKIFVDGKDVNSISIASLRKYCAYVPQDNFLFSDTIEHNIEFASDDVSHEKAVEAAKLSAVDDNIVEFAEGYDTVLGERGVTVSGGQKQRISIARALMKDASILILDDSVSAVDIETEKEILAGLRTSRKGKTTILIAHRVTTIEHMDKIIFIDDGNILAVGNHDELYESCPQYKLTVDLQRLENERGVVNA